MTNRKQPAAIPRRGWRLISKLISWLAWCVLWFTPSTRRARVLLLVRLVYRKAVFRG